MLTLNDRVLYHALIAPLRPRIESRLVADTTLLWPRAMETEPQWNTFEKLPTTIPGQYIVRADISGFYESIDHSMLRRILVVLTGRIELVDALVDFLTRTMGQSRGIPQGLAASDVLATAYISSIDAAMLRSGLSYWRHGDDVRITVHTHDAGRRAVFIFENELRKLQLRANSEKTMVLKSATYDKQLRELDIERETTRSELAELKKDGLLDADPDELERLLEESGIDEDTAFQIFYHHTMSIDEIADELRDHLEPSQVELAAAMFRNAVKRAPNSMHPKKLQRELFHGAITSSLTVLIADRSTAAIDGIGQLLQDFPDETATICAYLRSVASKAPEEVSYEIATAIRGEFLLGWQYAWLFNVLFEIVESTDEDVSEELTGMAEQAAVNESIDWIARAASIRLLGRMAQLVQADFIRLWGSCPSPLHPELADAVCMQGVLLEQSDWARQFTDSLVSDPVLKTVTDQARNRYKSLQTPDDEVSNS